MRLQHTSRDIPCSWHDVWHDPHFHEAEAISIALSPNFPIWPKSRGLVKGCFPGIKYRVGNAGAGLSKQMPRCLLVQFDKSPIHILIRKYRVYKELSSLSLTVSPSRQA
jgi:hypothetical protein